MRKLIAAVVMFTSAWTMAAPSQSQSPVAPAQTAPPAFNTILYGAAYYSEYMPTDRLDKDVAMMKAAGFNVVRMGESTWSLCEPEDAHFLFAWMDRVVDAMRKAGIKVIMDTPTYSIPAWMAHQHPEIPGRRMNSLSNNYGMRQNMDTDSPAYRFYAERLIRHIVAHYKNSPSGIDWQIDNETSSNGARATSGCTWIPLSEILKSGAVSAIER